MTKSSDTKTLKHTCGGPADGHKIPGCLRCDEAWWLAPTPSPSATTPAPSTTTKICALPPSTTTKIQLWSA